jgi:predicted RNA-binding Zn-ribbon protein involved in translation (DUF1610 family)
LEAIQTDLTADSSSGGGLNATDSIVVYERGKTWDCPECGHGIGTEKQTPMVKCESCGEVLVDREWACRNEPTNEGSSRQTTLFEAEEDDEQSSLAQFTEL